MMEQIKRKYKVFLVGHGEGCYAKDFYRGLVGETWAVSPAKAISNIKYRLRQQGDRLPDDLGDSQDMGYVHFELEAEIA